MGKVKSAIITVIVALAVVVLFLFGVITCRLPGGIEIYNSILSSVHLGSDLSGEAYTVLLPDGVITAEEYELNVYEDELDDDTTADDEESYAELYVASGSYYIELDVLSEYIENDDPTEQDTNNAIEDFKEQVRADAEVLAARFDNRNLTSYSVSVIDGLAIRVSVPTNFTYAAYSGNNQESRSSDLTDASLIVSYLSLGGELTLRNTDIGSTDWVYSVQTSNEEDTITKNIIPALSDVEDIFKSVTYYSYGGTYAIKFNLTDEGQEVMETISKRVSLSDDTYIRFYVGDSNVINLTCEETMDSSYFYIESSDEATARSYVALLNSVATGQTLEFDYTYDSVLYGTPASGEHTALLLAIAVLVILVALMSFAIWRYRLLGLVFSLMLLAFADAVVTFMFVTALQLTTIGVFAALACLMMFTACSFWSFEAVRSETQVGRTIQASVKVGYKKTFTGILELHLVLLVVGIMLALICLGEASVIGLIILAGSIASYALLWFTRFMWYVTMSPAQDKYKFCGFKREVSEDNE